MSNGKRRNYSNERKSEVGRTRKRGTKKTKQKKRNECLVVLEVGKREK